MHALISVGETLRKHFKWSSTKIKYWGSVEKAEKKDRMQVEYYATYGFKNGKGDCYVMAATFCYDGEGKRAIKMLKMVKGTVPQRKW